MSLPQRHKHKKSKTSLVISIVVHVAVVGLVTWVAARQGILGKQIKEMVAVPVEEPKKPEETEKPKETKNEPPKQEDPRPQEVQHQAPVVAPVVDATPPPADVPPPDAPAINGEAEIVIEAPNAGATVTDPIKAYQSLVQSVYLRVWDKPDGMDDSSLSVDADVRLSPGGEVISSKLSRGSGDSKWDKSVAKALERVKEVGRALPPNFPNAFTVRFDTYSEAVPVQ